MRILIVASLLAMLALAACSGGEAPMVEEAPAEVSPQPVSTKIPTPDDDTSSEKTPTPVTMEETAPVATPELEPSPEPTAITLGVLPFTEFPDDIAFLTRAGDGLSWPELTRIYKGTDGVIAETLLSQEQVGALTNSDSFVFRYAATPNASRIIATICLSYPSLKHMCVTDLKFEDTTIRDERFGLGRTALYESTDGGVTWQELTTFELPWLARKILSPEEHDGDQLVLSALTVFEVPPPGVPAAYPDPILWPSGRPAGELAEPEAECPDCYELPDGRILLMGEDGGGGPYLHLPSIQDPETKEVLLLPLPKKRVDLGREASTEVSLGGQLIFRGHGVQIGPFLRVTNVEGSCLNIRVEPNLESQVLTCVAQHVLLQDQGEAVEVDGTTWRKAKTPAGVTGWADGRYLE